jgi:hypothetical protein
MLITQRNANLNYALTPVLNKIQDHFAQFAFFILKAKKNINIPFDIAVPYFPN